MLNPLLFMAILGFVFSHIIRFEVDNYRVFLLSGILIYNFFSQSVGVGVNSITSNGALIRKVKLNAAIFPAVGPCTMLVNFVLALIPYFLVCFFLEYPLPWTIILTPIYLFIFLGFIYGASLFLASLNVFFRDVSHTMEPILTMLFYATPIIYPISALPEEYQPVLMYNPLYYFTQSLRDVMFRGSVPSWELTGICIGLAVVSIGIGFTCFHSVKRKFIFYV